MILKSFELKNKLSEYNIFLLYGKNDGKRSEIIEKYFTNDFDGIVIKYDEDEFINSYETIVLDILNRSLFDNKKIYVISRTSDKIIKHINELLLRNLKDIKIVLKSGILEKKSKLRNFFEKGKELAIIPFYADDTKNLTEIIYEFLKKNNIKLSRETINLLTERANGNRESLKNELEKILNYSYTNKNINHESVQKLSNLSENYNVSELADHFLAKNIKNVTKILNENNYSDEDCILILRTILSKSKRLLNIIENNEKVKNVDTAILKAKPPIFWKDKEIVKKQVNTWDLEELKKKVYQINEIEILIKTNTKNSLNLISDFIINY